MSKSKNTNNVTAKMYDTLVRPVITEKSMLSSENGKVLKQSLMLRSPK